VLDRIVKTHPELEIAVLLRNWTEEIAARYPTLRIIEGDFDSLDVIKAAAGESDVVIHCGWTDHLPNVEAILGSLKSSSYYIHLSGTGCITDDLTNSWKGEVNARVWSDIADCEEIKNLAPTLRHRKVDYAVQHSGLKTAIICPGPVFGQSPCVSKRQSTKIPLFMQAVLGLKTTFYLGTGQNTDSYVHIDDLAQLFDLVLQQALAGTGSWGGAEGFYFAASIESSWKAVAEAVNEYATSRGVVSGDVASLSEQQFRDFYPKRPEAPLYLWGSNNRIDAARARQLGWKPTGDLWSALPRDIDVALAALEHGKLRE